MQLTPKPMPQGISKEWIDAGSKLSAIGRNVLETSEETLIRFPKNRDLIQRIHTPNNSDEFTVSWLLPQENLSLIGPKAALVKTNPLGVAASFSDITEKLIQAGSHATTILRALKQLSEMKSARHLN